MVKLKNNFLHDERSSQIVSWGHWFALFNSFVVIILGSGYLFIADWPQTSLGRFYAIISCIGHFSFLTFITYLILLFPLSFFLHSPKWQRIIAVIIATIAITILLIDIEVFTKFRMHLNLSIWQILTSADENNIFSAQWQRLFIFVPLTLLLEIIFAIWSWRKLRSLTKRSRYSVPVVIFFLLCFIVSHLVHIWADANFYRPITMQRSSLPLSYPLTARHFLEHYGFIDKRNYESRTQQEGNPFAIAVEYPLSKINYEPIKTPYNILMIVIDNLDSRKLTDDMPKLTAFANQHLQFTNHYSSSYQDSLANFSLFYGLDPNYYNSILASHKSSVFIDTLTKQRYNLGLFSSNNFNHALYHYALLSDFSIPADIQHQSDAKTSALWLSWYNEQNKLENSSPWFSIIQYQNNQTIRTANQYKSLDQAIDEVLDALAKNGELNKTVVVITGSNGSLIEEADKFNQQNFRVPLIVAWPDKSPEIITAPTSHVDVVPTLMDNVLNVKTASKLYSQGENLFVPNSRNWLIAGNETDIAALYPEKTIVIDAQGNSQLYDSNGRSLKSETLSISTFLQLITENRRFIVTN